MLSALALAAALAATSPIPPPPAATPPAWETAALYGGDVRTLAYHPDDPDRVIAGTSAGHLYVSADGGASWSDIAPRQPFVGWVVSALAFDPNRHQRLWVGLWGVWGGGMVAFTDDLGGRWEVRGEGLPGQVYSLALVPGDEGRLYVGTRDGVWGSDDGGSSWRHLTGAFPEMMKVTSLLVEPLAPRTVYAGSWQRAYRSDDGGATWRGVFEGMELDSEVFTLEPVPGRPGEMWASTCGWMYRTLDGGGRWQRFQEGIPSVSRRTPSFKPLPSGRLLAGTTGGLYRSDNGGATWQPVTRTDLAVLTISYHPERPASVLIGTEGDGVWRSTDGGQSFAPAKGGMTNVRVAALARTGREVLAAVNHAGPASGVWSSIDGGATFQHQNPVLPTTLGLAVDDAGRVYAATDKGFYERSTTREWRRVGELGEARIEGVEAAGDHVVARTAKGLWTRREGRFVAVPYRHGPPRSALPFAGALWVTDGAGLYRLSEAANDPVAAPVVGARLAALGDALLLAGAEGAWLRTEGEMWRRLAEGEVRALTTGSERFPALLVGKEGARLVDREGGSVPLALDIPARDVTAALLSADGRLLLGTAGYGVLRGRLDEPTAEGVPAGEGAATTAGD